MNRYLVRVGFSCTSFGNLSGVVYAESQAEAEELVYEDIDNIREQDFDTNDSDNYNYYSDEAEIDLDESDVTAPQYNNNPSNKNTPFSSVPNYFLAELNQF